MGGRHPGVPGEHSPNASSLTQLEVKLRRAGQRIRVCKAGGPRLPGLSGGRNGSCLEGKHSLPFGCLPGPGVKTWHCWGVQAIVHFWVGVSFVFGVKKKVPLLDLSVEAIREITGPVLSPDSVAPAQKKGGRCPGTGMAAAHTERCCLPCASSDNLPFSEV